MRNRTGEKLSERLSNALDHMDETSTSYVKIKNILETEYQVIQGKLNPKCDEDVKKELNYHFYDFVQNTLKKLTE